MNYKIKKDERSNKHIHQPYGTSNNAIKKIALKDISDEEGTNYIYRQSDVFKLCELEPLIVNID